MEVKSQQITNHTGSLKKAKSVKAAPAISYKKVELTADISAYILHAYLRDSHLELPEHAA